MANQTVSTNANHDALTGRSAGEDFTITSGATLTIDSMPHLTAMGILGDITISDGTLHIDGSRTFVVTVSGGGSLSVGDVVTWSGGTQSGKYIGPPLVGAGYNITVDVGSTAPAVSDTLQFPLFSTTVTSVKVGYLRVFGEDQDWGSVDARSTLRITGDWYEVGTGSGSINQAVALPHNGHQAGIWVETGLGTDVYEIWHRANVITSTLYYTAADFGTTFDSGLVFTQPFGSITATFISRAIPSGARIRIPNVHIGTTTVASPTVEINAAAVLSHIGVVAPNTNLNVEIDHLNASSAYVDFRGTNQVTCTDSCWGIATTTALVQKVNAATYIGNCCIASGSTADYACTNVVAWGVVDNVGGITIHDTVIYGGVNASNAGAFILTTMSNLAFTGTCKLVTNQQDENTFASLRGAVATNITAETLILCGGPIYATAGCVNWTIDEAVWGYPPGRGTTEENASGVLNASGTSNFWIKSGRFATGGAKHTRGNVFTLSDCDQTRITNFGAIDAKIDCAARALSVWNLLGVTTNTVLKRLWFINLNATQMVTLVNSVADVLMENCSGDYNDEIENDATRVLCKGVHGASGNPDAATGVEGDLVNCLATCFLDYFKSDTTGALGLIFNDRGVKHASDVTVTAGTPLWNGLGDLLMRTSGDQVIYEWPYLIKGHTAFQNVAVQTSAVGSYTYEYALDTGAGYGAWTGATGPNLSAEVISPGGFRIKVRITATANNSAAAIKGFAIRTDTTLAAQSANFYPLDVVPVTITVRNNSGGFVENARVLIEADTGGPMPVADSVTITRSGTVATVTHTAHGLSSGDKVVIRGANEPEYNIIATISRIDANSYSYEVTGAPTTPATGTITCTFVALTGVTNASGVLSNPDFPFVDTQPVTGKIRSGSAPPFYKTGQISGTIEVSTGLNARVFMVLDE